MILSGAAILATVGAALFVALRPAPAQRAIPSESQIIEMRVGNVALQVRAHYLRHAPDRAGGRIDELHLAVHAPDFGPRPLALGEPEAAPDVIYLTLQPPETAVAPSERMARLYARFLERGSEPVQVDGGLMMRAFEKKSPYEHEALYFNPPEGGLFTARCLRPPDDAAGASVMAHGCIADLRLQGLDVRLRFSASLLEQWEELTMETTRFVAAMVQK